jgi:hypothetical protein
VCECLSMVTQTLRYPAPLATHHQEKTADFFITQVMKTTPTSMKTKFCKSHLFVIPKNDFFIMLKPIS